MKLRRANRRLETAKLLALLREETPRFFELAEVVGKWVWIQFTEKQPSDITRVLAELGFHWNNTRQTWQHPCGTMPLEGAKRELYKMTGCSSNPISNDMGMHRSSMPEDIRELLELIRAGKLFALQEWIKAGKRLDAPEIEGGQVLQLAVDTGFHI
ncbi:MAG TPA: hypothetical protein VH413_13410 [Verrucomicrobiae bacterium]|nr:hypothetical protein [Verrucomicrobiae bacterium]